MKLLCFTSAKGGVGTSFALALISFALAKGGKRCLVADMCIGRRTMDLYMGADGEFVFDMQDVLLGNCSFEDAVVKVRENLDFLSCSQDSENIDYQAVTHMLKSLGEGYDYIMVDCPSEYVLGRTFDNTAVAIIVTSCDKAAVRCTEKLVCDMLADCSKYLIINNIIPELIQKGYHCNVDDICDLCGVEPIGLIPYEPLCVTGDGLMISDIETLNICRAISNTARRIEGESVAAVSFGGKTQFCKLMKKYSRRND